MTDFTDFPSILRFGAAYMALFPVQASFLGLEQLQFTGTLEYQNVLNNEYRTGIRIGTETVLWDALAVRLGYLSHSLNDNGLAVNRSQMTDFTFGFGLIIPLEELTSSSLPFNLHVDFTSLKQPPTSELGGRRPNMRTFSFRLVWVVND